MYPKDYISALEDEVRRLELGRDARETLLQTTERRFVASQGQVSNLTRQARVLRLELLDAESRLEDEVEQHGRTRAALDAQLEACRRHKGRYARPFDPSLDVLCRVGGV